MAEPVIVSAAQAAAIVQVLQRYRRRLPLGDAVRESVLRNIRPAIGPRACAFELARHAKERRIVREATGELHADR